MQTFDQALLGHVMEGDGRRGDRLRVRLQPARLQAHARGQGPASLRDRAGAGGRGAGRVRAQLRRRPRPSADPLQFLKLWLYSAFWPPGSEEGVSLSAPAGESEMTDPSCPVCRTAEIISGKWTLLVIRDLADANRRFCELERSLEGISPRTLSLRLRALEECGIVERHTYPEVPPRVEYALTEKGRALVPLIEEMRTYGRRWLVDASRRPRSGRRPAPPSPPDPAPTGELRTGGSATALAVKERARAGRRPCACVTWSFERGWWRWPTTRPSACASWSPPARRSPTRSASRATARRFAATSR